MANLKLLEIVSAIDACRRADIRIDLRKSLSTFSVT